jgi:hypothetical protein
VAPREKPPIRLGHLDQRNDEVALELIGKLISTASIRGTVAGTRGLVKSVLWGSRAPFKVKQRQSRTAQNPKTLERVEVPPKRTVKFKVGRLMKQTFENHQPPRTTHGRRHPPAKRRRHHRQAVVKRRADHQVTYRSALM